MSIAELTALKKRANIIFREWSPLLGDVLNETHVRLGDSLTARIADTQRVIDLTEALCETLTEINAHVSSQMAERVSGMRRSLAAVKANQTRKARKEGRAA